MVGRARSRAAAGGTRFRGKSERVSARIQTDTDRYIPDTGGKLVAKQWRDVRRPEPNPEPHTETRVVPTPQAFDLKGSEPYPYLVVNIGSGVSILKVPAAATAQHGGHRTPPAHRTAARATHQEYAPRTPRTPRGGLGAAVGGAVGCGRRPALTLAHLTAAPRRVPALVPAASLAPAAPRRALRACVARLSR